MDDERRRILRMVAEGKITSEEAAGLLDALQEVSAGEARRASQPVPAPGGHPKTLVIHVSEGDESKVNVRIPLGLALAAGRFIPRRAQEYLEEYDIDVRQLVQDIGGAVQRGPIIEIKDDEDHVLIAVE